jgi:hypothetical protein
MHLMQSSLTGKSVERLDSLGLPYPGVSPKIPSGCVVGSVVLRSVFQYMWTSSGNVIEVSIYRVWDGCNTSSEPKINASLSAFNPRWDLEMASVENTTSIRDWDRQLKNFFGEGGEKRHEEGGNRGLARLLDEIEIIQGFLKDATENSTLRQNATISSSS